MGRCLGGCYDYHTLDFLLKVALSKQRMVNFKGAFIREGQVEDWKQIATLNNDLDDNNDTR
jgi:hypothetical protein